MTNPHTNNDAQHRDLLTVEDAAHRLSLSRTTMFGLIKNGDVTSIRIGRNRRIPNEAITAYIARLTAEQHADDPTSDAKRGHGAPLGLAGVVARPSGAASGNTPP